MSALGVQGPLITAQLGLSSSALSDGHGAKTDVDKAGRNEPREAVDVAGGSAKRGILLSGRTYAVIYDCCSSAGMLAL